MADRKAVNKYYPPDYDPSKGSINTYRKSHPLRHRAKKIDEGILIVRFELPLNIVCLKCGSYISMGKRYNAEKTKIGNYYSTPIYSFKMKCQLCDNHFVIQTQPSKLDYEVIEGARKQVRTPIETEDEPQQTSSNQLSDAMSKLEKKVEDQILNQAQLPTLKNIVESTSRFKDEYAANSKVRAQFRAERRRLEKQRVVEKRIRKRKKHRVDVDKLEVLKKKDLLSSKVLIVEKVDDTKKTSIKILK